jgi:photosystem II stability/assembly factor-like uncharacterized protein
MKKLISILPLLFISLSVHAQDPVIYWHQTSGPAGGTVSDITLDSSNRVIVWTRSSGVYRSSDSGKSWYLLNSGLPNLNMYHGAYGSGYLFGINSARDGQLFRYNEGDPNAKWQEISPPGVTDLNDIVVDPLDGTVYLAGANKGVWRSDDTGKTWKLKGALKDTTDRIPLTIDRDVVLFSLDGNGNIFAGMKYGSIFRSSDKGETWIKITTDSSRNPDKYTTMATMVAAPNGNIIIGTDHPNLGQSGHIFLSVDTGKSWITKYTRPVNTEELKDDVDKIIRVPGTSIIYANAHGPTLRSPDNGVTWTIMDSEKRGDEVFSMAAKGNVLYQMCEPDGVLYSDDNGANWDERNHLLFAEFMWGIALNSKQTIFCVTEYGLWRSADNGDHWEMMPEYGEDYGPNIAISKKDNIFIGTTRGLYRSQNNGDTVGRILVGTDLVNDSNKYINTINQVGDNGHGKIYCATNDTAIGFLYSTDEGDHWAKVPNIPNQNIESKQRLVKTFAFASVDTMYISAGVNGSSIFYRTTDGGVTWDSLSTHQDTVAAQILVHPDGSLLLRELGETGGIFRSTDGGFTFKKIFPVSEPLLFKDFFSMMVDSKGTIIVTTDYGIYRSTVGDVNFATWYSISNGLTANDFPDKFIKTAAVVENPETHVYFAATRGVGVYRSIPNLGIVHTYSIKNENNISAYPNPSTASATISVDVKESGSAYVDIFDILGRKVKTIYQGIFNEGKNTFSFDASSIPSGNYMLVLSIDGKNTTSWITISH